MSASGSDKTISIAPPALPAEPGAARQHSYGQILKSSALIGGASVLTVAVSVIRTKVMAVLLGPAGFGLTGLYLSILDLARAVAAMGVSTSGVRQIAAAVGTGDEERISRTVAVLRWTSVVLGIAGAALLAVCAGPIARFTFSDERYAPAVALLSLAVLFNTVGGGRDALIQGMRRIGDLARIGVFGAILGVAITIPIIYWLREDGIALSLVCVAAVSLLLSLGYSRKVKVKPVTLSASEVRSEAVDLLKLGLAFLASGLLTMGAAYVIRLIVLRQDGLDAAGFYQSAWALGGLYVGIVLQAMGADFYPRLTAAADDNEECNRLVNEQSSVSLLLAGPGVLATLTFAPLVIAVFYSAKFTAAVEPLRWICLGMALRVLVWPLGFIVVAKNRQAIFFWTEVAAAVVHVGLALLAVPHFGVNGAAMAFAGLYVVHGCVISLIVRRMSGFRWSSANIQIGLVILPLLVAVFCCFLFLPFWVATSAGVLALLFNSVYSLRTMLKLVSVERIPRPIRRLLVWFKFVPPDAI